MGFSIVVVEDDALIGLLLAELLAGLGHTVCATATTEADAVECALRFAPDLMLVDLGLAHGDGRSAMRTILAARRQPHVFMTGASRDELPPGSHVLAKPFFEADLIRAIDAAVAAG